MQPVQQPYLLAILVHSYRHRHPPRFDARQELPLPHYELMDLPSCYSTHRQNNFYVLQLSKYRFAITYSRKRGVERPPEFGMRCFGCVDVVTFEGDFFKGIAIGDLV